LEIYQEICERRVLSISSGALPHAGGTAYKGKVSVSVDASIESTGTDASATVAASDDDDGDGDGDPDSDRRKLPKQLTLKSGAVTPATKSLNTEYKRREAQEIQMTIAPATPLPQTGFVRLPKVLSIYPVSKSTWWAGIKSGKYPAGIKLSERVTAWRVEDIHALISQLSLNAS
jgi:predicted DNA-binding transcriptional regulator AlpA